MSDMFLIIKSDSMYSGCLFCSQSTWFPETLQVKVVSGHFCALKNYWVMNDQLAFPTVAPTCIEPFYWTGLRYKPG